jgi:hypothetical protein
MDGLVDYLERRPAVCAKPIWIGRGTDGMALTRPTGSVMPETTLRGTRGLSRQSNAGLQLTTANRSICPLIT